MTAVDKKHIVYRINDDGSRTAIDISRDSDGDLITHEPEDNEEYNGKMYVINWNYLWLSYKRGWKDGKAGCSLGCPYTHPKHVAMYYEGYEDGENDFGSAGY